jgi:hypothetical protein
MLYSSGTTGRPKGVRVALSGLAIDAPNPLMMLTQALYGLGPESRYLTPAPLYHAAPLRWTMTLQRFGATTFIMEKFDPETYLGVVEKHAINASQLVPTMFVRMLKLPENVRAKYDVSSMKMAIHAAAPCPGQTARRPQIGGGDPGQERHNRQRAVRRYERRRHQFQDRKEHEYRQRRDDTGDGKGGKAFAPAKAARRQHLMMPFCKFVCQPVKGAGGKSVDDGQAEDRPEQIEEVHADAAPDAYGGGARTRRFGGMFQRTWLTARLGIRDINHAGGKFCRSPSEGFACPSPTCRC